MCRMQFVHKADGSWARKSSVDPIEDKLSLNEVSSKEENDNHDIEGEGTQNEIATNL